MDIAARRNIVQTFLGGVLLMTLYSILKTLTFPSIRNLAANIMKSQREVADIAIRELSLEKASEGLQSGLFSSVDLVNVYLARIDEVPEFNAVLQVNLDALATARSLDEERIRSGSRGPLHGIPILVKDNIATNDEKLDVSAGSFALLGAKPANESSVISKLRAAGVVILGKTNLSEWANFRGLDITDGWSPRGGQTLGIYYPNSSPSGSSAGSAVAVALGLSTAALGTETVGSITSPAELNNVVGLKPTRGLIGNDGAIPISCRQDIIGTLTTTVKDAAYLLSTMAGRSEQDERTWNIPPDHPSDYTTFCTETDLRGISIGVPRNSYDADATSPITASFEAALKTLSSAGARVVDSADFPAADGFKELNQQVKGIVRSSEFKRDVVRYIQTLDKNPNNIHSVEDIIEFTKTFPGEEYPKRDIGKFLWTQVKGVDVDGATYAEMVEQERYFGGEGGILGAMEKYEVDVFAVPSDWGIANDLAAKMGFPVISVPLGYYPEGTPIEYENGLVIRAPGIPYALTLITKAFSDHVLLRVAYAFEQLTAVRSDEPEPIKLPKTELRDVQSQPAATL